MTLAEFLLARIAEDEAVATSARTEPWDEIAFHDQAPDDVPHIARHSPARVLTECEAKRRIVEGVEHSYLGYSALLILAAVYADHPDYREEWKL